MNKKVSKSNKDNRLKHAGITARSKLNSLKYEYYTYTYLLT